MKKIVIATHSNLAEGFKDTLNYIAPNTVEVEVINAYIKSDRVEEEIEEVLNKFDSSEQILVFTDLLGGSVNQEFAKFLNQKNIHLIAGANLPVILTLSIAFSMNDLTDEDIVKTIEESRNQLVYVNEVLSSAGGDDFDE